MAGNHSEIDRKTVALDSRPEVAELKEFKRSYNDEHVWSRPPQIRAKNIGRVPVGRRIFSLSGRPE